jgi:hypothetical protein
VDHCPLCGAEVPAALIVDGGTCPRCFGRIPGEDAPTDPGRSPAPAPTVERSARAGLVGAWGAVGVLAVGVLAVWLWPRPEPSGMLDFDALDFPVPEVVAAPSAPEPVAARATASTPRPELATPEPAPDGPAGNVELSFHGGGTVAMDLGVGGPSAQRGGAVLSDPSAIRAMIGRRMASLVPSLQVCYDRRLKVNPALKGRWRLAFTVRADGGVEGVGASGVERSDRAFEVCLAEHVREHWSFQRIAAPQPVSRTLRFEQP